MSALIELKQQGKIHHVSNFPAQLEEIAQYGRIDSLQPPYSLFWQVEADAMPIAKENISILPTLPLGIVDWEI